jgi:hypothetical protein
MAGASHYVLLTSQDEEREKLRSVFAIGAIAFLFYFRQVNQGIPVPIAPWRPDITSDTVIVLWGVYVLAMAVALTIRRFPATTVGKVDAFTLMVAYAISQAAYILATFLLLIYVVFHFLVPAFYPINLSFYAILGALVIVVVLISLTTPHPRLRHGNNSL